MLLLRKIIITTRVGITVGTRVYVTGFCFDRIFIYIYTVPALGFTRP